jgi:hypothetical protein
MAQPDKKTTVTAGKGYGSAKSTGKYAPGTAPVNYQEPPPPALTEPDNQGRDVPRIVLEPDKPGKPLNVSSSFLESFSRVYISGQYPARGHADLKIKAVISLIARNSGLYHVTVVPSLKDVLLNILENGDAAVLGREMNDFERKRAVAIYKHDNML